MVPVKNKDVDELIARLQFNVGLARQLCEDARRIRADSLKLARKLNKKLGFSLWKSTLDS